MPRNGSGVYSHPFPDVVEGTTIESAVFNGNTSDVEQDLNTPRPIVAGGTGANNAHDAMVALSGEIAQQGPITNYDSFPFVNGSFYSETGATAAPPSGGTATSYFDGICYVHASNPGFMTLEARDIANGVLYVRQKRAGVWTAWMQQAGSTADLDAAYVNVTGDTMSGPLIVPVKGNQIGIHGGTGNATSAVTPADANFLLYGSGVNWAGMGADAGGNVWLRTGLSGTPVPALAIFNSGQVNVQSSLPSTTPNTGSLVVAGGAGFGGDIHCPDIYATRPGAPTTGYIFYGNATKYMGYDGTKFVFNDATTVVSGAASTSPTTGALTVAGGVGVGGALYAQGACSFQTTLNVAGATNLSSLTTSGDITSNGGNGVIAPNGLWINPPGTYFGLNKDATPNNYLRWDSSTYFVYGASNGQLAYVRAGSTLTTWRNSDLVLVHAAGAQKPGGGAWGDSSDSRIKNELGEYPRGLAEITQLRPIYYTFKGNDTDTAPEHVKSGISEEDAKIADEPVTVPYPNSNHSAVAKAETKYTGLIAQEVEAIFPEMVTKRSAYIDGQPVDDLRDLDTTPMIFALINAVKELTARLEALEGGGATRRR